MSLLTQQIILGRALRAASVERALADAASELGIDRAGLIDLDALVQGPGFRFTRHVQRSWCIGRTAGAAQLTLSLLTIEERRRVVADWVDGGGGASLDLTSEAAEFLELVALRLDDPSHALAVCRMEQAAYRASSAAVGFAPPAPGLVDDHNVRLRRGRGSSLIYFFAEPRRLFAAIVGQESLPPLKPKGFPHLFAPGLAALRRPASRTEARIWDRLTVPASMHSLRREGFPRRLILQLLAIGAIECGS